MPLSCVKHRKAKFIDRNLRQKMKQISHKSVQIRKTRPTVKKPKFEPITKSEIALTRQKKANKNIYNGLLIIGKKVNKHLLNTKKGYPKLKAE